MRHFVGLDVSLKSCAICIVDDRGSIAFEGNCITEPDAIVAAIARWADTTEAIVHETGPLSIWLTRELEKRDAPVICIDARAAHKALSARMNKSDRSDAAAHS